MIDDPCKEERERYKKMRKMQDKKDVRIDLNTMFNPDLIRRNLLISSLYMVAYELLMLSIVEGVRDVFLFNYPRTQEERDRINEHECYLQKIREELGADIGSSPLDGHKKMASEYKQEIGFDPNTPDNFVLIPSCEWLSRIGVLSVEDIELIRQLRNHRHKIAHELPYILVSEGYEIEIEKLNQMREILHKVEVFWFRSDIMTDLDTGEEFDTNDVADDEIGSGREAIFQLIYDAVYEYVEQFTR